MARTCAEGCGIQRVLAWLAFALGMLLFSRGAAAETLRPEEAPAETAVLPSPSPVPLLDSPPAPATPLGPGLVPPPPAQDRDREGTPPFTSVLPPSLPLPPAGPQLPGVPPPGIVPAPFALPERPGAPPPAGGLRQALSEYDRRSGMGVGGSVAGLARSDLMDSTALGSAVLEFRIDRSGVVRAARVVRTSRDLPAWQALADDLRSARLERSRMPDGAAGAFLRVQLDAQIVKPSGVPAGQPVVLYPGAIGFDLADLADQPRMRDVHVTVLTEVWY